MRDNFNQISHSHFEHLVLTALLPSGGWLKIGAIPVGLHLNRNDEVLIQFFDNKGYLPELSFNHLITSTEDRAPSVRPKKVAIYINKHFNLLKAGQHIYHDNIQASYCQ